MRTTVRHWGPILGVALLLLVAHDVPSSRAAADSGRQPWLGVYTQSLTSALRDGLDYNGSGVLVNRVISDSPADKAGLEKGDVITRVGTQSVSSPEALARVVRSMRTGQNASIQIVRDGQRRTLNAQLEARPENDGDEDSDTPDMNNEDEDNNTPDMDEIPVPPNAPEAPEAPKGHDQGKSHSRSWTDDEGHNFSFNFNGDDFPNAFGMMGRGRLGVRVENLNRDLGDYFGVADGKGALVVEVVKDTPAERAGLKAGDVITSVGEKKIYDTDDLVSALRSRDAGRVSLDVIRHGSRRTIEAELERAPRAMRLGRGQGMMGYRDGDGNRRIVIRNSDRDQLQREVTDLRKEVKELQKQLDEMKRRD